MGNIFLGFILGLLAGIYGTLNWDKLVDLIDGLRGRLPESQTVTESWLPKTGAFFRRWGIVILIVVVLVSAVLGNTVFAPREKPDLVVGYTYQFYDACGQPNLYAFTLQDAQKNAVVVGAGVVVEGKSCQLTISNLSERYNIIIP